MRTCLVGQSKLFRAGLSLILRNTAFEVDVESASMADVLAMDLDHRLVIIHKPAEIATMAREIEALKARAHPPSIILIAKSIEADQFAACFACGVDGYLLEDISPEALIDCLHLVSLGEKVFPSQLVGLICGEYWNLSRSNVAQLKDVHLSERELHIVQALREGCSNKVIATRLSITEATVKVHVKAILKKLGAQNRTQAAIWAVQQGFSHVSKLHVPPAIVQGVQIAV